jgi:serine/threonine protein kinase
MDTNNKSMLQAGTILHGTYRIEKMLGQGSFGITYLAEHIHLGKKVAIKEFFMKELNSRGEDGSITGMSDGSLSYNYARKFKKEAFNLSRLDNPNIVRVTDSFDENGTFYYVMDYIEGKNLNDYIKTNHVSESDAIDIILAMTRALMYMHEEKHMLHLDLKPGNVMRRDSDGQIFLIDFGLSKHYSNDGQPETSTTIGLGTAGYAPIEQGNKTKDGEFRPTIDVYALGATFYKLLTRETPPAASDLVSDDSLLEEQMSACNVSKELIDIVIKAMNPNVKKRFQSVREFKDALCSFTNPSASVIVEDIPQSETNNDKSEETVTGSSVVDETGTSSATIGNSFYEEDENGTSSKKRVIIGFLVAFVVIAAIVFFSQKGASTDSTGGSIEQVDSVVPEVVDTMAVEPEEQTSSQSNTEASASKLANNGNKDKNASQEKTKDVKEDNASTLKSALAKGNYKKVQQLANEGYSAAYGPLAKYYLQNNEYSLAETYAKKAKAAGFSEGSSVLRTLESLGYYD